VHVRVDGPGHDEQPARVDVEPTARSRSRWLERRDATVVDGNIELLDAIAPHHSPAAQDEPGHLPVL
jgi:hypothetical protein